MAIVVQPDYHYGLARMHAAYRVARESSRREVMAFTSREQADGWLARPRARS
ncbi:MAG: hypothetical protein OXT09_27680 [Myxococcales bacterium]|nr:hypothetical protein [Myxococcales bacterium]